MTFFGHLSEIWNFLFSSCFVKGGRFWSENKQVFQNLHGRKDSSFLNFFKPTCWHALVKSTKSTRIDSISDVCGISGNTMLLKLTKHHQVSMEIWNLFTICSSILTGLGQIFSKFNKHTNILIYYRLCYNLLLIYLINIFYYYRL